MVQFVRQRATYPAFMQVVDAVCGQNPLQAKRIAGFIAGQDEEYWTFAEDVSEMLHRTLIASPAERAAVARAYNDLCMGMVRDQIAFRKTGIYPADDVHRVRQEVYDRPETMHRYMVGLLVSQMLWPNHYQLFRFFQTTLHHARPTRYLEVGAGHGLFIRDALRRFPSLEVDVCEISAASIAIAQQILAALGVRIADVRFTHSDFFAFSSDRRFDFITAGEVLEHVQNPVGFLVRMRDFLAPHGTVYLSTCVNCPAVDHVYHFHSIDEIRAVIADARLIIVDERVLPAEDVPCAQWQEQLITVNYGAALRCATG